MFRFIAFIIITIICINCDSKKTEEQNIYFTENNLPKPIKLFGEKYNFPEIINPRGIFIKDNYALVFERKNTSDNKFHVIDLQTGTFLRSKGIDGVGPGEITVISQIEDSGEMNTIWSYDPEYRIYSRFNLNDDNKLAESQIKSPETSFFITEATWTSDSTLLGGAVDGWTKYLHLTLSGDTLALFGDWHDMIRGKDLPNGLKTEELDANLISNIFQGPIKSSPDKRYAVKVGRSVDYIDIIDLKNNEIKTVFGPILTLPEFKIGRSAGYQMPDFGRNKITSYSDVFPGQSSFFVMYRGKPYRDISDSDNLNRIFEFNYEGKILRHFHLDFPLMGFSIDEQNRAIYGVTVDKNPNLVRFDY